MSPKALQLFLAELLERELIIEFGGVNAKPAGKGIQKIRVGPTTVVDRSIPEDSIISYNRAIEASDYAVIFKDGSLAQVEYSLKAGKVIKHRYCYIPCPVDLEQEVIADYFFEEHFSQNFGMPDIKLRSRWRFDYDAEEAAEDHPKSHITTISNECRIAVRNGVGIKSFFRFVIRNFVDRSSTIDFPSLAALDFVDGHGPEDKYSSDLHFSWQ